MAKIEASSSTRTVEMWLLPFAAMFTRPSWLNAVALATGALLCLNRRTVCAALRAVEGSADKGFSRFHRFLSRAEWSGLQGARILLGQLQAAFVPAGEPLVIAVDDSVERRRGAQIRDKGVWRDAVRSSRGVFVKVMGLRWLSLQVVVRPGFASRTWGLQPCCRDRQDGRSKPNPGWVQAMRTEIGRPSSNMRFRAWTATSTSVARRWSVRQRSPSPITCLNLPIVASTRDRIV